MSKVTVQVLGADHPVVLSGVSTVADAKAELSVPNHAATIEGEPAADDQELFDGDFVDLAPAVKGG